MLNFSKSVVVFGLFCSSLSPVVASENASWVSSPSLHSYANITSSLDQIISRGYLKVGTTGDYKPYSYLVTNRSALANSSTINTTYIGADIDAAQSLSNALGLPNPVNFVPTVWANLTTDLSAGKFDIAMGGISKTLARARSAMFSVAITTGGKVACIRCSDASKFMDLATIDQPGVKVVVNPGGTNQAFDVANLHSATIVLVQDNNAVYEAVLNGTGDAMISDLEEVELQIKLHPGDLCLANSTPFDFEQKGYMMGKDVVLKTFVDEWVNILLGSGAWNSTFTKWIDYEWPSV